MMASMGREGSVTKDNPLRFLRSGFPVLVRDENRSALDTLAFAERTRGLDGK